MNFHSNDPEGPPCRHMEGFLQRTADGSAKGIIRWYATSHASQCGRCGRFLERLTETIGQLRDSKEGVPDPEVAKRLASGRWREEA